YQSFSHQIRLSEFSDSLPHIILKVPGTLRNLKAMGQCLHFGKSVQDKRVYHCECGNEMGRDRNAAINIREEARRMLTA
ncbi:transposase, partial [Anaerostipes hadrus]|uniref:transposase n=1 Tax=Anaerostipes hadrus TaxID=649756 RepID=UPI001EDD4B8B